jgi:CRP/FNR family transcriptional regulator, cyclic AMP receptor protein
MASPAAAVAKSALMHLSDGEVVRAKSSVPYGLPIVDDCTTCKLRNSSFFCAFEQPSIQALNTLKHTTSYPEGAMVFMEGQAARGVYIVCQGRAKLMTTSSDGKTLILKIAQPGDVLGMHAVVSGRAHEFTVETLQPCQLAYVSHDDFLRFLKQNGDACLQAAQHISRDCQAAYESIRSIGLSHSVTEKLARLLLQWSADGRVSNGMVRTKLALTHEEIAQLIGSTRETVTRTLSDLKRRAIAELTGSTLLIRNLSALQGLASI